LAEETLVGPALSDAMITAGADLVRRLDGRHVAVDAALWVLQPEAGAWRLILASPDVRVEGPRAVYKRIQKALPPSTGVLTLGDVSVVDTSDQLIQLLRVGMRTGPALGGIRFVRNSINGVLFPDAYIYRVM
jgi:hypothetical protein